MAGDALLVDCDGTLHSRLGVEDPNQYVVDYVREAMAAGADLWVWTGYGVAHAAMTARKLGLDAMGFNGKSNMRELVEALSGYDRVLLIDDDYGLLSMIPKAFGERGIEVVAMHPDRLRP